MDTGVNWNWGISRVEVFVSVSSDDEVVYVNPLPCGKSRIVPPVAFVPFSLGRGEVLRAGVGPYPSSSSLHTLRLCLSPSMVRPHRVLTKPPVYLDRPESRPSASGTLSAQDSSRTRCWDPFNEVETRRLRDTLPSLHERTVHVPLKSL